MTWGEVRSFELADAVLEAVVTGSGRPVLLLPALGRDERDFEALASALSAAGRMCIALRPRGVGGSTGLRDGLTLTDFAKDAASVLKRICPGQPALVIGATFGNRVARALAKLQPKIVDKLILLAAGGSVPPDPETTALARGAMSRVLQNLDPEADDFAPYFAHPPLLSRTVHKTFSSGWHPIALNVQRNAARSTPPQEIAPVPGLQTLILQGLDDRLAPPENGRQLAKELGVDAKLVEIPDCGHLILLDQPDAAIREILDFAGP